MWNPFKRPPDPPRLVRRIEVLELRSADLEDSIEKVLYQQTKMMGKINARHKKTLEAAEAALEATGGDPMTPGSPNNIGAFPVDPKAELRARANELRRR